MRWGGAKGLVKVGEVVVVVLDEGGGLPSSLKLTICCIRASVPPEST